MRPLLTAATTLLLASTALAQQPPAPQPPDPSAATIMARVVANQDHSDAERLHYVYLQHARVASRKGQTLRCEEITDSRVTPTEHGSHQQLLHLDGRLLQKHQYLTYHQLPTNKDGSPTNETSDHDSIHIEVGDGDTDRNLVESMRSSLTDSGTTPDSDSKDGLASDLFPLTSKTQANYQFQLAGHERINGRDTFHITFGPKDKNDITWKGDAYIDTTAYQPVVVRTTMARKLPFAVRTLLGTSLPGLGFTVIYAPQPDGVWFPVSFGTEFKLKVLFFFSREITISAENRDFVKTHVTSRILTTPTP